MRIDQTFYVVEVSYNTGGEGPQLAHGYQQGSPKLYKRKCDASATANRLTRYPVVLGARVVKVRLTEVID